MSQTTIQKTLLVAHSAEKMYHLVDDVENYPKFLPWYGKTEILLRQNNELQARLHIDYMGIKQAFATHNHNTPYHQIQMALLDSTAFKSLQGTWTFTALTEDMCQVEFKLNYELIGILGKLISPVFSSICHRLMDAFVQEANRRYA